MLHSWGNSIGTAEPFLRKGKLKHRPEDMEAEESKHAFNVFPPRNSWTWGEQPREREESSRSRYHKTKKKKRNRARRTQNDNSSNGGCAKTKK